MKYRISFICFFLLISFAIPAVSMAGSFMVGAKGWYAFWNGSPDNTAKIVDDEVDTGVVTALSAHGTASSDTNSSDETGRGFLAGPVLAYQTDDHLWSFSLAVMYFSFFKYDTDASGTFTLVVPPTYNGVNDLDYSIELKRREIDVARIQDHQSLDENLCRLQVSED